ncbi:LAME_0E05248g1_1 [Lachancea meyersii CBS 8951]|uniref:LAME_0E05248g1_1 n=1 Tax=Lachancea meyersii CBS 8951 TaxID=1266667 RepID=A0A1G4JHP3_9SACH|nr:LAME_0E05248g1_1 [Lachancea meyersii CBS 8951]
MSDSQTSEKSNFGRRTWDRAEYAQLGRLSKDSPNPHLDSLTQEELQSLKVRYTNHNTLVAGATQNANQKVLTSTLSSYKRGKQFGFYCELCDLTFKDTLQFVDHLNHKIHQIKFETVFGEPLIIDLRDNDDIPLQEFDEAYSSTIREFLKTYGRPSTKRKNASQTDHSVPVAKTQQKRKINDGNNLDTVMGFGGFGTTKRK